MLNLATKIKDWKVPENPVTRFAPSPTGHLHLGHVASAIFVWGISRKIGAKIILRIEDHDLQRSKKTFEAAILRELEYLRFSPDSGVSIDELDKPANFRQSDHSARFDRALESLRSTESVYTCSCTRKTIREDMEVGEFPELLYQGRCRYKKLPYDKDTGLRVQFDCAPETFQDLIIGHQQQSPSSQCGDLLLKDKKKNWSYHFANVVDDISEGVNLIIRGQDL
ncbi:MAG: hypothetical protein GY941_29900, partial [Planctomycetes bacterium]|nr:hypothetical protein [Planctomycetota bacterium]